MRLVRAALVALVFLGSEVLAAPAAAGVGCCTDWGWERDGIDPLKSEDSFSDDLSRTKRKFKPEDMLAANVVLTKALQPKKQQRPKTAPAKSQKQARQAPPDDAENDIDSFDENPSFGQGEKVSLKIPDKLFGNATNVVLAVAKIFGDFITNTAIRSARFLQLFQPLFGRNLKIQIPTTTTESNEV
ncbi:uncharacterized protein LOC134211634 [Armigeres subalbatus]|uniref:uncharacterized protein LOC134211634 n=1 Tax=Armigeres subalbatus TaxID=124917 RepID=UPI002ED09500